MVTKLSGFEAETRDLTIEELLAEIEAEEDAPLNETCPYTHHCEMRRAALPVYRQHQPCHWLAFALGSDSWRRCPIFRDNNQV